MRILGLDVGDVYVGIAMCDPTQLIAQGYDTLKRQSKKIDNEKLKNICDEYNVELIVVGLPKNMDGTKGFQAESVERFVKNMKEVIDIPVEYYDERLTSAFAERIMLEANFSREKRKKLVDKVAASNILQGYLDNKKNKK